MNIDFTTIARGVDSGYQSASKMAIDNSERWIDLWQQHTYNTEPPPPVPQVDFTRYRVVAVFAGEKPTGGHSVEILSAETSGSQTQEQLAITVQDRQPSAGDFVTEALTYPYHMIKIPKIDGKVVFKHV
jgi:PrcB C-terminal